MGSVPVSAGPETEGAQAVHVVKDLLGLGRAIILAWCPLAAATYAVEVTSFSQNAATVGRYERYEATFALDTAFPSIRLRVKS